MTMGSDQQRCVLPAGNGSTTLVLEVYYNQAKNWLKQCSGTTVMLWAVVGATQVTSPPQVNNPISWTYSKWVYKQAPHEHARSTRLTTLSFISDNCCQCVSASHALQHTVLTVTTNKHRPLTQGPKDGVIIFKNAAGAILGEGPVQAVSVGHVGFSVTLDAKSSAVGLVSGTNTGALSRTGNSSCSENVSDLAMHTMVRSPSLRAHQGWLWLEGCWQPHLLYTSPIKVAMLLCLNMRVVLHRGVYQII